MRLMVSLALGLALFAAAVCAETVPVVAPPALTKDRLGPEALDAMVAGPMAIIADGDWEGGERAFEVLLAERSKRHGANSVEVADLLSAFGVAVHRFDDGGPAIIYLRRAVEAAKAVYGPTHPEVALAITDVAMVQWDGADGPPPVEVDEALREAYRIRVATLGPNHTETAWNLAQLAKLAALPSRIDGRPERVDSAITLRRQSIEAMRIGADPNYPDAVAMAYVDLAELYVRNGRVGEGLEAFAAAVAEFGRIGPDGASMEAASLAMEAVEFADLLDEFGHAAEAEAIRRRHPDPLDDKNAPPHAPAPSSPKWTT